MPKQVKKSLVISIYFALTVSTLLVFWQVRNFDFISYDDNDYVTGNQHVLSGLTFDNIIWAFKTIHTGYWHPLTWLSLMLDCQLFGADAGGIHLVNLFWHLANTLLLFTVLKKMTGALWQSAFVAAVFAIHPMHVESVAWIAERKDVLSTFFYLLTMAAYLRYVKRPSAARYLLALLIFALGLMAKPMLVILPFVLLLLDYWPINRIKHFDRQVIYRLVLEKIPFIVLSIAVSAFALLAQKSILSISSFDAFPLKFRIGNALISYVKYIEKMFWPSGQAAFYPHPLENVSVLYAVISAVVLLAVTILVIRFAKNHRYLAVGWFWYLGTLIPVIGIIQVGSQAYADRYTYIPYVGLFIMLAWGVPQLLPKWISAPPQRKIALGAAMLIILTTLGICAHRQANYWKNSVTLFSHTVEVTQNNWLAHYYLGIAYSNIGNWPEAIKSYKQTIKINSEYECAYLNLGAAYGSLGRWSEAIGVYKQAINIKPDYVEAYNNLGAAYGNLGRWSEAIETTKQAIIIKPDFADAHRNLGNVCCDIGRWQEAIESYKQAISIKPDDAGTHYNLGNACYALGRYQDAIEAFRQAIRIKPDYAEAYYNLGIAYDDLGRYTEAIDAYKHTVRIKPDDPEAHFRLGAAYLAIGDKNSAMAEYNILKSLNSGFANNLFNQINK